MNPIVQDGKAVSAMVAQLEGSRAQLYIDGEAAPPASGRWFASYDPCTTEPWYEVADAGAEDVDRAVQAAKRAYRAGWGAALGAERAAVMLKVADAVEARAGEFGELETRENGKLLRETTGQAVAVAKALRYYAGMADKIEGTTPPPATRDSLAMTLREPYGVIGVIVPWNSPLSLMAVSAGPALAAGNAVVVKPSEDASGSLLAFAELATEAGLPPGIFNVVTGKGPEAGRALAAHPDVGKISFTGGEAGGRAVAETAAQRVAPVVLELGGKSPHILLDDCDLERAIPGVVAGIFAAAGQTCVAGSRCFVHRSVHDEVVERLGARADAIVIGDPREAGTQIGPVATRNQFDKVSQHVAWALEDGATLVAGGAPAPDAGPGWYYRPTIFSGVTPEMRLFQQEVFGPVLAVIPFDTDAEALELANQTRYGLASGVWTSSIDRALRFVRGLEAGTVWVNTFRAPSVTVPNGGFKASGYGRLDGMYAVREFTREKSVIVDFSGAARDPFVMKLGDD
jgi:acyl-CoA reductase-like NAD-dependent aldehyde dehydrogenase